MAIIGLGVGFLSGVRSTSVSMLDMGERYFSQTNLSDYRLISPVGFDEKDIEAVSQLKNVTDVMPSYYCDVYADIDGSSSPLRARAMPTAYSDSQPLNMVEVTEGRLPEKSDEAVIDSLQLKNMKIGDTLTIADTVEDKKTEDTLNRLSFKIVGKVRTPENITFERDSTTLGDGRLKGYFYIMPECFKTEKYSQLYVKTAYSAEGITPFEDSYTDNIDTYKKTLKATGKACIKAFISDKQSELDDKKSEYFEKKADALDKLKKSENKLIKAKKKFKKTIKNADIKLAKARSDYSKGIENYNSEKEKYEAEIKKAKEKIAQSKDKLKIGWKKYNSSKKKFDQKISDAKSKLSAEEKKYKTAYNDFYNKQKPDALKKIKASKQKSVSLSADLANIEQGYKDNDILKVYTSLNKALVTMGMEKISMSDFAQGGDKDKFDALVTNIKNAISAIDSGVKNAEAELKTGETALKKAKQKLAQAKKTLKEKSATGKAKLKAAKDKLTKADKDIKTGERELFQKEKEAQSKFDSALDKLNSAKEKIESSTVKLEKNRISGEKKLASSEKKLKKAKLKANKKFKKAEKKLDKAQKKINKYKGKHWYILTREDSPGYSSFRENAERVDDVATVFPIFFLLVAILVCVTTMSRLVDEKRTEIGTLKALGYSNADIMKKYLIYSLISCIAGCIIGIAAGVPILPRVIYNAYKIMYHMQEIRIIPNYIYILAGVAAAVLSTLAVTLYTCGKSLKENAASLMRPKAPKPGTKIILEKVTFIWKKMSFTGKVTARNLFRYKARFLMTVFGVAGCTALILAAFYLHDSISDIVGKQYNDVYHYDALMVNKKEGSSEYFSKFKEKLDSDRDISHSLLYCNKTVTVRYKNKKADNSVYIFVPEDMSSFEKMITLQSRTTGTKYKLGDEGAVITEKMASVLNIKKGDTITVTLDSEERQFKVDAVCENYVYNYVYISPNAYKNAFGKASLFNTTIVKFNAPDSKTENTVAKHYLSDKYVSAIAFNDKMIDNFNKTISSLDTVVLVMIICAGLLAIVVLYNLTNINIAERVREISTLKVLGFYNGETSAYIYRENIVLTIFGIAFGLFMGVFLGYFIVITCEIDTLMFGRVIKPMSYLYAGLLTAVFSLTVNFIMHFKIRKIDMIESLKSIE